MEVEGIAGITRDSVELAHFAERLRGAGQRATPQRLVILAAFDGPGRHLTADEVFAKVAPAMPSVNRSTVYRTLELYRDLGLISETDLGNSVRQYELIEGEPHHHLICRECEETIEFPDSMVQELRQSIRMAYGFVPVIDHLAVFGTCAECSIGVND